MAIDYPDFEYSISAFPIMGIKIFVLSSNVHIKKEHFTNVLASLPKLQGQETTGSPENRHFMWLPCCNLADVQTLKKMRALWRWPFEMNEDGDIDALFFTGEKRGDENLFFAAIAPYVSSGSEIVVLSEGDGEGYKVWRWLFNGQACQKQNGHMFLNNKRK